MFTNVLARVKSMYTRHYNTVVTELPYAHHKACSLSDRAELPQPRLVRVTYPSISARSSSIL